jgi:hypothetical protein
LWKGIAKPLALAGMIGAVVVGFFHYMKVGPNVRREVRRRRRCDGHAYASALRTRERMNHWFIAILFVLAGLVGPGVLPPRLFFLTNLFGGGPGRASCIPSWGC